MSNAIEPSSIENTELNGGLNVGHNIHAGGEMTVAGDSAFDKDVRVGGWLYAPNIVDFVHNVTEIAKKLDDEVLDAIGRLLNMYDEEMRDWVSSDMTSTKSYVDSLLASAINELTQTFLSKVNPDTANGLITFMQGLISKAVIQADGGVRFGDFLQGLSTGKGGYIDNRGNAELQTLRVRGYMKVMELITNRLRAEEGDVVFSDSGTIDSLIKEKDGTFTLTMRKRWDNDFTSFHEGDVVRGKLNNLLITGEMYTSWFRVLSVNTVNNTLSVICYPDEEVPDGVNFAPEASMVISRWGNAITPTDGSYNSRQTSWYISCTEGRIVYLQGVTKPILEDYNYGLFLGLPVDLPNLRDFNPDPSKPYLYAKGLFAENFTQVDYLGNPIRTERCRGKWSLEVAQSDDPYIIDDTIFDTVYHHGCKWQVLISKTLQEPMYNSTDWVMIEGNTEFVVDILSSEGWGMFDPATFQTTLSFRAMIYNEDVTSQIIESDIEWRRDTGDVAEDTAWAVKRAGAGFFLPLTTADLPADHSNLKSVKFIVTVTLRDGEASQSAQDEININ